MLTKELLQAVQNHEHFCGTSYGTVKRFALS